MVRGGIEPNVRTYATLMDSYAKEGKLEDAFKVFDEMCGIGLVPNIVVYNLLMNWLFKKGYMLEARFLLSDMKDGCVHPYHFTYSILVDGNWRNGHIQEAVGCYNQTREQTIVRDVVLCNGLMNYFLQERKGIGSQTSLMQYDHN